jgi:hypothetical protein
MIAPQLFPLNAPKRAICEFLLCRAVVDHMNAKLAARIPEHTEALNRLASRPQPELLQAVSRQICTTDPDRLPRKPHGDSSRFGAPMMATSVGGFNKKAAELPRRLH